MRCATHHLHVAAHHASASRGAGGDEFAIHLKYILTVGSGDQTPLQVFGLCYGFKVQFNTMDAANLLGIAVGNGLAGLIGHHQINDIGLLGRLGQQLLKLKSTPLPAAPFSISKWMLFSFCLLMFSTVIKTTTGSSTATAPINIQGGTPVQNFLFFDCFNIAKF